MPKGTPRPTPNQRQFARQLRTNQTDCELLLWQKLRSRQIANLKFRRQFPCPPYILDFYCAELKLAIELDGGQHYTPPSKSMIDDEHSIFSNKASRYCDSVIWKSCTR